VLGTLGTLAAASDGSFAFLFLRRPDSFMVGRESPDPDDDDDGTDDSPLPSPEGRSLDPLSGLDGFEDEYLL